MIVIKVKITNLYKKKGVKQKYLFLNTAALKNLINSKIYKNS